MSHFYASVHGKARTEATRCGTKSSGINAHISSWDKGIMVTCEYNNLRDSNLFKVYLTKGSNKPYDNTLIYQYEEPCASNPHSFVNNGIFSMEGLGEIKNGVK